MVRKGPPGSRKLPITPRTVMSLTTSGTRLLLFHAFTILLDLMLALGAALRLLFDVARTVEGRAAGSREVRRRRERALTGFPFAGQRRHRFWKAPTDPSVIDIKGSITVLGQQAREVVKKTSSPNPEEIRTKQPHPLRSNRFHNAPTHRRPKPLVSPETRASKALKKRRLPSSVS